VRAFGGLGGRVYECRMRLMRLDKRLNDWLLACRCLPTRCTVTRARQLLGSAVEVWAGGGDRLRAYVSRSWVRK
jgi:hypothetical protein